MLTKSQCAGMTEAELVKAERAFRVEIPRAQAAWDAVKKEIKRRTKKEKMLTP